MLKILDSLYFCIPRCNVFWRLVRYGIRVLANLYARYLMQIRQKECVVDSKTVIVSLTSFPARIENVWITIATLLNQNYKNMKVMLWLSRDQFTSLDILPKRLLALQKYGLEINLVDDDLRPHKKYFYAMQKYPDNDIITVDDDILYNPELVSSLVECSKTNPGCVICHRGVKIGKGSYSTWKPALDSKQPSHNIMPTGIGGVLYPRNCYDKARIFDVDAIKKTCLHGDDLWLNLMTRSIGTMVVLSGFHTGLVTILSSQQSALCNVNIGNNRNDQQITALDELCREKYGLDFFVNVNNR